MEKKELKYTKRKLTIIFTIMIFLLVFVLGFSYFIFRYFSEKNQDVNSFISFVNSVSNSEISKEDILNRSKELPKPKDRNVVSKKIDKKVNYLFFGADGNVVSSDLRFNISDENYEQILKFRKEYLKNNVSSSSGQTHYYEKKVYYEYDDDDDEPELETKYEKVNVPQNTKNSSKFHFFTDYIVGFSGDFVFLKEFSYKTSSFVGDLVGFLVLDLLFSFVFYLAGYKFVNRTFKPIEENMSDMKNFIHNAGHELKTPIAVIDSNIQLLRDMKTYDDSMMLELKEEVLKLNSLLDSLIKLSDIGSFEETEKINLSEIIDEIVKSFSSRIEEKNISFEKSIDKKVFLTTNRNYLYIFISNIIGNAIKYNKQNGKISISYNHGLLIEDSGIGIDREDLKKVFDRFFKSDKSRNSEGFGIGLSLVKKISEVYSWKVRVESEIGVGTKFFIKF
ncbi:sensor histidine kinase [Candidatus Gracilibacteria bacterium]|nr:MAG: sensor histidine kinase [Candidatus Gracilibacteria bacterium]